MATPTVRPTLAPVSVASASPDVVDVRWIDLDVERSEVDSCAALLTDADVARVGALATDELRRRATVRLGRRREMLAEVLGVEVGLVDLRREPSGRPYALGADGTRISVSASSRGSLAVVACAPGLDVGVDVEADDELGDAPRLVEAIASSSERAVIDSLDAASRRHALVVLWTRKEAVLKATGEGVGGGLSHLTVPLDAGADGVAFRTGDDAQWWRLYDLECPRDGLAAALVVGRRDRDATGVELRHSHR